MKTFNFVGKPSGDGECFAFEVTEETYKRICGNVAYNFAIQLRTELAEELGKKDEKWFIHPDEFFEGKKELEITIIVKEKK